MKLFYEFTACLKKWNQHLEFFFFVHFNKLYYQLTFNDKMYYTRVAGWMSLIAIYKSPLFIIKIFINVWVGLVINWLVFFISECATIIPSTHNTHNANVIHCRDIPLFGRFKRKLEVWFWLETQIFSTSIFLHWNQMFLYL